ncbi:hypothetical protein UFOVP644_30 [uncultured Caudovirales phage]|uniref:Uncharacterized protein n=2 Tax=uncultured Caudovirales phage TaxID=2100421 RepID=A0A6J5N6N2_9CAUD|nr:hypothetical protein UFOVP644_30 [uncultured Caudovirales phage]CAB4192605.1 hypothetical protein UFOVP1232_44 [uncultured Caudovirales phage]CAB5230486.1 hypothetical protein UFOVP1572_17 [uncultured Caudovirales phage]
MSSNPERDIAKILMVKTRMDFLLLTMSPDKVRDQLIREYGGMRDDFGILTDAAVIVARPD